MIGSRKQTSPDHGRLGRPERVPERVPEDSGEERGNRGDEATILACSLKHAAGDKRLWLEFRAIQSTDAAVSVKNALALSSDRLAQTDLSRSRPPGSS